MPCSILDSLDGKSRNGSSPGFTASGAPTKAAFTGSVGPPVQSKKEAVKNLELLDSPDQITSRVDETLVAEFSRRRESPEDLVVQFFARR